MFSPLCPWQEGLAFPRSPKLPECHWQWRWWAETSLLTWHRGAANQPP
jgi:hypothetical protein